MVECSVDGCSKKVLARGWCRTHYTRWYETGSTELGVRNAPTCPPRPTPRPVEERFWPKVDKAGECWLWKGAKTKLGYGLIWVLEAGRSQMAHRVSWEMANGRKIPDGLHIDHSCRTPSCVNPDHLEPVTVAENTRRGYAPSIGAALQSSKTHCPQGHEYTEANTYRYNEGRTRMCRTCAIKRTQARRAARAAASGR